MEGITSIIGTNLKKLRKQHQFTLEQLAQKTGVSTSMLCDIEHGLTNPTITVVWKIADGLKISFSDLIKEETPTVTVAREQDVPIQLDGEGFTIYAHHPFDADKKFEIFSKVLAPGATFESDGHRKGMQEYLLISQGILHLQLGEQAYTLKQGDSIRFAGNVKHLYHNPGEEPLRAFTMFYYGDGGE
ncbi:MAG: helix-turn-helix transcriptional regulator [Anaerolineaceae bacterium]|nr:helix-turn-helix transcriptional regulator [Anaerolineaceae bacterium]